MTISPKEHAHEKKINQINYFNGFNEWVQLINVPLI